MDFAGVDIFAGSIQHAFCHDACCDPGQAWIADYPDQQARQEVDEFVDVEEVGEGAAGPPCSAAEACDQQEPNSAATVFTSLAWEEWRSWNNTQDNHLAAQRSSQNAPLDLTHKMTTPPSTPYCPQTYSPPTYSPPLPPTHPYHPGGAPAPSAPQAEFTAFGRRRWFTCEICLRVFNKKFLLTQHALSTHPTESTLLRCQELKCNYVCRSRTTLNKHVAKQHAPKTIRCPHCPEAFSMHWSLNEHISQMHTFYRCRHCHRAIGDVHSLSLHEEERECLQCGMSFGCVWLFAKHWQQHPVRVKCNFCPANFKMPTSLEHHVQTIHRHHLN